jgi:hypothetical protein
MSEPIASFIQIGGIIKKELLESTDDFTGLIDCLISDGAGFNYDELGGDNSIEDIRQVFIDANVKDFVTFYGKPNYGEFPETEDFCKKHNIDFDRHSDCSYELEAENIYVRNSKELSYHSLSNGKHDMVLVDDVLKVLKDKTPEDALRTIINAKNTILQRPKPLKNIMII